MLRLFTTTTLLLLSAVSLSCDSIDVPPPPDIEGVLAAYAAPTANVRGEIMAEFAPYIEAVRNAIEEAKLADLFLALVIKVQRGLNEATNEDGTLDLAGLNIPFPSGVTEVKHICPGWEPEQPDETDEPRDRANGVLDMFMPLKSGSIGALVWGIADECRFLEGDTRASFDGPFAMHFGKIVGLRERIEDLIITFVIAGNLLLDDDELMIEQSFRVTGEGRLEILIESDDFGSFVYFFELDRFTQGIRDTTGSFVCNLEIRECGSPSGTFRW